MIFTISELCEVYGILACSAFAFSIVVQMMLYGIFKAFGLVKI